MTVGGVIINEVVFEEDEREDLVQFSDAEDTDSDDDDIEQESKEVQD